MGKRIAVTSAMVGAIVCALAAPAAAHVTVDPPSAPQGSTVKLSFLVPNEEPTARVTELQVAFPTPPETPIPTVTVGQKPGWTVKVTMLKLAQPLETDDGTISEVVSRVDWKAKTAADAIPPDQFGEFTIDADGLPDDEDQVVFRAIQTYSNKTTVSWVDPVTAAGPEAEHPTPILKLTAPASDGEGTATTAPATNTPRSSRTTIVATSTQDNSARALGIIALVLGAIALILATGALMKKRRA
jgi:periplasmic copper chaperone A